MDEVMNKWETILDGPFKPTWESLRTYEAPEWFRNAKFGI
jgi:alpha-L-fucosidase